MILGKTDMGVLRFWFRRGSLSPTHEGRVSVSLHIIDMVPPSLGII